MPKRPGNEVGCSKIPLALGKLIFTSKILPLFREILFSAIGLIGLMRSHKPYESYKSYHNAPGNNFYSSSRRRLPPGMMPFGERPQIPVGARDHDSAAVVVNEEVVVLRPFARKIDHHV